MATQVDGASLDVSAETVGHAFVGQFYRVLHESPALVYRFFQDTSTMTRPDRDGKLKTVTAMEGINELILSLECKDYIAEILTADAQASHKDGVIVLVTGCLTGKDNVRRKFTESFFLAPQEKGYFVLNNAFRFVEDNELPQVPPVGEEKVDINATAVPLTPVQENVETSNNQTAAAEAAPENEVEVTEEPKGEQKSAAPETSVPQAPTDASQNGQLVVETSSNGHADAPKKSYASLLKNMKGGASTTLVRAPTTAVKAAAPKTAQQPAPSPAAQQSHSDAAPATVPESAAPNGSNINGNSVDDAAEKGHSVYIGSLPYDATPDLVEQEFKKFGRIKRNGIQVRSNKDYCFGFVEYEDAAAKQKAIEMGTVHISGKEVFIEEKRTSTRVVNGVSMYPSGRGGFRGDGFRGRGNYSNGRGYARNEFSKRNGDAPPRSNRNGGDGFHGPYQNGGGRGARQAVATK